MARAANIYLVKRKGSFEPEAAFTVKHEMETFLDCTHYTVAPNIWRITDGLHDRKITDITDAYFIK